MPESQRYAHFLLLVSVAQQTAFVQVLLHVSFYTSTAAQIRSPFL